MPTPIKNGDAGMNDTVPYAASLRWYAAWFRERLSGRSDDEAVATANRVCRVKGKAFTRTAIGPSDTPMLLSVAVEGGASVLKRGGAECRASVSLHGRWPHVHLGALEAHYGRAPYYQHIMPGLRGILDSMAPSDSLMELNRRVHLELSGFLPTSTAMTDGSVRPEVLARGREIASTLDEDLSVIDALMHNGPETALALVALSDDLRMR